MTERKKKTLPNTLPLGRKRLVPGPIKRPSWKQTPDSVYPREDAACLHSPVGPWSPQVTECDQENTTTTLSSIKIEQFIQDTEYDLLILSRNKCATAHGGMRPLLAERVRAAGAGGARTEGADGIGRCRHHHIWLDV